MRDRVVEEGMGAAWRVSFLSILFLATLALFAVRLFSLQVLFGSAFRERAFKVSQRVTRLPPQRGEIYDRSFSVPLVLNTDSFAVDVIPADIPPDMRDGIFRKLSSLLGVSLEDIGKIIPPSYYHYYQPIEIASQVPYETITLIAQRMDEFPGVAWHDKPVRKYLSTGSISHVIGYVGNINREELQRLYNQGYQTGSIIGKSGIERQYDDLLRGREGFEYKTVDAKGRRIAERDVVVVNPEPGRNLVLSIDRNIQTLAEKALGERMGSIVVLKPATGEILAMVSWPWFDANALSSAGGNNAYSVLLTDSKSPLINRAIQSAYPPASTFKIIMSAAIYEEEAFPPEKTIDCDGEILYGDRTFRCWIRRPGHGPLDLRSALAQSCDVYFWTVAKDALGIDKIVSYAREFGFSTDTKIDLPGETAGFIPTPQWKERRFHEKWLGGDTLNMAIGQGYTLVTPLQMVNMVAMVVNDGLIYQPHILREIREAGTGAILEKTEREILHRSDISKETFERVRENMRAVITEGTAAYPVNIKAVEIAGKTGTGEVGITDHWHSWFAAYAPWKYEDPEEVIAVSVIVEAGNDWEWWAPYATAIVYQGIFAGQNYEDAIKSLGFQYLPGTQGRRE